MLHGCPGTCLLHGTQDVTAEQGQIWALYSGHVWAVLGEEGLGTNGSVCWKVPCSELQQALPGDGA